MNTLRDLGGTRARPTATVTITGVSIVVRDLSYGEARALENLFPLPTPPMGPDPSKGSLAPHIPLTGDPGFRSAAIARRQSIRAGELAIATGWKDNAGHAWHDVTTPAERTAWIDEAQRFIDVSLGDGEVERLDAALQSLATGQGGRQEPSGKD